MVQKQKVYITKKAGSAEEALKLVEVNVPKPKSDQVLIKHTAIGLNFHDVQYRRGSYPLPTSPMILGMEAVGEIVEVGSSVVEFKPGQRVGFATMLGGGYAEYSTPPADRIFPVPPKISDAQAVTCLTKGMTAHYLMRRTYYVRENKWVVITAAAGGVGHLVVPLAKFYGANVIALVGRDEKKDFVKKLGADLVINYEHEDYVNLIKRATDHKGASVVYDSVGNKIFSSLIDCIEPFGLAVSFGESSGAVNGFDLSRLSENSVFITKPVLQHYKRERREMILSSMEVFDFIFRDIIPTTPNRIFKFNEIPQAHKHLESRESMGSNIVLIE